MDDATRVAIQQLQDAHKKGLVQQGLAALGKTAMQGAAQQAIVALQGTETQGIVQQAIAQLGGSDWRKTHLDGTATDQYKALMSGVAGQQSVQSAVSQMRAEFDRTGSADAKRLLSSVAATSPDLTEIFNLPGIVSSNAYVQSLANQAGQISAAVANTAWGQTLAKRLSQEGLTGSFFEDLIDYTKSETENELLAADAYTLGTDTPPLKDDKAPAAIELLPTVLLDLALKSPELSAAIILVFGIHAAAIFSNNPELDRLKDLSVLFEMIAGLTLALRVGLAELRNSEIESDDSRS